MAAPFIGDVRGDIETYVIERWPYAIIKSSVGLYQRMRDYEADIDPDDPIQIGGDFLSMGMESAVISGTQAAARLLARLAKHQSNTATKLNHVTAMDDLRSIDL